MGTIGTMTSFLTKKEESKGASFLFFRQTMEGPLGFVIHLRFCNFIIFLSGIGDTPTVPVNRGPGEGA
jgi:hypothetical protein